MDDRPSLERLEPGVCLAGKYRLERLLGRGGMGVVYAATNLLLEVRVAIKLVRPDYAEDSVVLARLLEEARCAAQITSEHVVRVLDVGRLESGAPFIAMEFVEGEDVYSLLERERVLSLEEAVTIVLEASIALAEAHHKGIVHRDLKPENLFLTARADGSRLVKVLDFGISKRLGREAGPSLTTADSLMGSPDYMAPEQMRSPLGVDARADIWSLGAILYQLVTGRVPFEGASLADVCARVLEHEPQPPSAFTPGLPKAFERVVMQCLSKDRTRRFPNVRALARSLEPFAREPARRALSAMARLSPESTEITTQGRTRSSTHAVSVSNAVRAESGRSRARSIGFVAAALALVAGSALVLRDRAADPVTTTNAPAAPTPQAAAPLPEATPAVPVMPLSALPAAKPTSAPEAAAPVPAPSAGAARPTDARRAARPRASLAAPVATSTTTSAPLPSPTTTEPATAKDPGNAWSLDSFGGRR